MRALPLELVTYVYELATFRDSLTASRLCLVNRASYQIALPWLYEHVALSSTDQIKSFNSALDKCPRLADLVQGITLLDDELAVTPYDAVDQAIEDDTRGKSEWIRHWRTLIRTMSILSSKHHLSTLVISSEACKRLSYKRPETGKGAQYPLAQRLERSEIVLDHLVLSHTEVDFFLTKIKTKKLTWYGCLESLFTCCEALQEHNILLHCAHLEEVHCMMGHPYMQQPEVEDEDTLLPWIEDYKEFFDLGCHIDVTVYTFRGYPIIKAQIISEARQLGYKIKVDEWASDWDESQDQAVMKDFARRGWVQKKKASEAVIEVDADDADSSEGIETDGWKIRKYPGEQWCGCCKFGSGEEETSWDAFVEI